MRPSRPAIFFFTDPTTTEIYTLSLHDALPICLSRCLRLGEPPHRPLTEAFHPERGVDREDAHVLGEKPRRSEEHTSELQSLAYLVCRLLLEKKNAASSHHLARLRHPRARRTVS